MPIANSDEIFWVVRSTFEACLHNHAQRFDLQNHALFRSKLLGTKVGIRKVSAQEEDPASDTTKAVGCPYNFSCHASIRIG